MTGTTLYQLIQSLRKVEYRALQQRLHLVGDKYPALLQLYYRSGTYDQKSLCKKLQITARQLTGMHRILAREVVQFLCISELPESPESMLAVAKRLVHELRYEAAHAVLKQIWKAASQVENFQQMMQILSICRNMSPKFTPFDATEKQVVEKSEELETYRLLLAQFRDFRMQNENDPVRMHGIRKVRNSVLVRDSTLPSSLRAKCHFHKIRAGIGIFDRNYRMAAANQSELYSILSKHQWISEYGAFPLHRERIRLIYLHIKNGEEALADRLMLTTANEVEPSDHERFDLMARLYPMRLSIAMQKGDQDNGDIAFENMMTAMQGFSSFGDSAIYARNIYLAAYYQYAIAEYEKTRHLITRLNRYPRSDFPSESYAMTKVLQMFTMCTLGDDEEVSRLVINFRKTRDYRSSEYYQLVARFLTHWISLAPDERTVPANLINEIKMLALRENCRTHFNHFNLLICAIAMQEHKSMIEIFRNDAPGTRIIEMFGS